MTPLPTPVATSARMRGGLAEDLRLLADQMQRCQARRDRWLRWRKAVQALRGFTATRFVWVLTLGACAFDAISRAG